MRQAQKEELWYQRDWFKFLQGLANANLLAAILLHFVTHASPQDQGGYAVAATMFVPLLMGVTSAYFWRDLNVSGGRLFLWSLLNTVLASLLAAGFLGEGVICLLMAAPLLSLLVWLGAAIGQGIFRSQNGPLRVSVVPVLLVLMTADCFTHQTYYHSVTTEMTVNATPAQIYPHIIAFPAIAEPSDFLLCRLGLPYPKETTVDGPFIGAHRSCRFSGNVAVEEKITALIPDREIDFDVTQMPQYPEIADHATLERGRIALRDNCDGTTTLVGTSWYALRVAPAVYFGPWTDYLIHVGHNRVFTQIKKLSETRRH